LQLPGAWLPSAPDEDGVTDPTVSRLTEARSGVARGGLDSRQGLVHVATMSKISPQTITNRGPSPQTSFGTRP